MPIAHPFFFFGRTWSNQPIKLRVTFGMLQVKRKGEEDSGSFFNFGELPMASADRYSNT